MAKTNADLSTQLAERGAQITPLAVQDKLDKWKAQHGDKLIALAGDQATADKVFVVCMNTISRSPALLECSFPSIAACILQSFQLNLFPGPFSECSYVPLRNGRTGQTEANFWPGYQGIVKLMLNAGNKTVVARVVFENDSFEYREGLNAPAYAPAVVMFKKRGRPLFAYAAVCTRAGMWQVEVMDLDQIAAIKSRSRGASKPDSPWNSKYEDDVYAMWAKTVLKRVAKWCTKSAELVAAVEADNEIDGDPSLARAKIIDLAAGPDRLALGGGEGQKSIDAPAAEENGTGEPTAAETPENNFAA